MARLWQATVAEPLLEVHETADILHVASGLQKSCQSREAYKLELSFAGLQATLNLVSIFLLFTLHQSFGADQQHAPGHCWGHLTALI